MRRNPGVWIAALVAIAVMTAGCGTQKMGDNGGTSTETGAASSLPAGDLLTEAATGEASPGATVAGTLSGARTSGAPTQAGGSSAVARTASDRGVTKDQITLGILATNEATFSSLGYTYEGKKHEQVIKPFVDEINERGGINGRKLVVKITRYNPLVTDEMNSACVAQAEDLKVFASISPAGFWGDAEVCMSTKGTPLVTGNNSSADTNYRREKGWTHQTLMTKDRMAKDWVDWMIATGQASPKNKNGVVYTDVPEDRQFVNEVFIPYMKQRGLKITDVMAFSYSGPSADTSATEASSGVLKFKADGVDLVWPVTNFLQWYLFLQQADAAAYHPKYSGTDLGLISTDATSMYPASQWEGVTAITAMRTGEVLDGTMPKHEAFKECYRVYQAHGEKIGPDPDDASKLDGTEIGNVSFYCEHIALFAEVAKRAGTNPTRRSFLAAFDGLGTWSSRVAMTDKLSFAKGKVDGADNFAVVKWQANCTAGGGCYRQVEGFRKGTW